MSINDEIGSMSGSQFHFWGGERTQQIVAANKIAKTRSEFTLDFDPEELPPEIAAAEIAREIYDGTGFEFSTATSVIARLRALIAANEASQSDPVNAFGLGKVEEKHRNLVGLVDQDADVVSHALTIGWLSYAFDAGATPADLEVWGVDPFIIIQLQWWQRRDGETLLNQHIRALRNGWGLPWLSFAARSNYGNLIREINRGNAPVSFLEAFENEIAEVKELLTFFGELDLADGKKNQATTLSEARTIEWAHAFAENVSFIAPDAKGRWGMLPAVSLRAGELRGCATPVARYLDQLGYSPSDIGGKLTEKFFGRVGDQTA